MGDLPHDIMGYDRAITVFSPDGRLLQVEYTKKTIAQGSTAVGITCKEGVVLVADKRIIEKLILPSSVEKIFQIDKHIGASFAGLLSDGRVLIQKAQTHAQSHKVTYNEPIDALTLVKDLADQNQLFTQYGGVRPYGVALLIAAVDDKGTRLFVTEPSGIYFEYKATAIGEGAQLIKQFLEEKYRDTITIEQAIKLGIEALKTSIGKKFSNERIDISFISVKDREYKKLSRDQIDKYLKVK